MRMCLTQITLQLLGIQQPVEFKVISVERSAILSYGLWFMVDGYDKNNLSEIDKSTP